MAQKLDELESAETTTRKTDSKIPFFKQKFALLISLLIAIIILLCVIILLLKAFNVSSNNISEESDNKTDQNNIQLGNTLEQSQIPGSNHKMIYRYKWGGRPALYERPQKVPVKYVIISHTAGVECFDITACSKQMVEIQNLHVGSGRPDIGYNFVIGGDANIYVGRGWDIHNFHMNLDTIGISFIGNYVHNILSTSMIEALNQLLKLGVDKGKLDKDYILVAHNQTCNTVSPGANVYNQIKYWPHFSSEVLTDL